MRKPNRLLRGSDGFIAASAAHRLEAFFTGALAIGLRLGESLGLRWQDVDLHRGLLYVARAANGSSQRRQTARSGAHR
ncbi:MAG: tyrosine-type recombinase/integrase [Luteitalea sp.]|nr:tyrosine-type recombinase/integrase [Luteitalea sp.]